MKRAISLLIVIIMLFTFSACLGTFIKVNENLSWGVEDGTLTISESGSTGNFLLGGSC